MLCLTNFYDDIKQDVTTTDRHIKIIVDITQAHFSHTSTI